MVWQSPRELGERYSPLYFLAALGAGGMVVTFFMWLMFWVPHPDQPVPVFEDLVTAYGAGGWPVKAMLIGAWLGIGGFAVLHLRLLIWNINGLLAWSRTPAYQALRQANEETQLLAAPLTVAMSINVGFILGMVFVPGLWSVVEWLFPLAMLAFLTVGVWALRLMGHFWGRIFVQGGFDCSKNNSFAQLLPAFALSMVGVGLAAPAAMSTTPWISAVSYIASSFFVVSAVLLATLKLVLGLRAMMEHGASVQSAPTLWIVIPILTVLGIALMRQEHGLHAHLGAHGTPADTFTLLTTFLAVQLAVALFGWVVLSRLRYFQRFVLGEEKSPGSYALVCPGVALTVLIHFFINKGLVGVGLIEKFDAAYWVLTAAALGLQLATLLLVFRLNGKHFRKEAAPTGAVPAM